MLFHNHPPAPGYAPVRPASSAAAWHDGAASGHRNTSGQPGRSPDQFEDPVATRKGNRLVWTGRADGGNPVRHCAVASSRTPRADPLCHGARRRWRTAAASLSVHRSQSRSGRHPALVCSPLVHRGDVRRGPSPPRCRDATAVVRSSNCTDDARVAGPILARHALGARTACRPSTAVSSRRLVSKAAPHVQRRTRPGSPRIVDATGFRHVPKRTQTDRNAAISHQRPDRSRLLCRVDGQSRAKPQISLFNRSGTHGST